MCFMIRGNMDYADLISMVIVSSSIQKQTKHVILLMKTQGREEADAVVFCSMDAPPNCSSGGFGIKNKMKKYRWKGQRKAEITQQNHFT